MNKEDLVRTALQIDAGADSDEEEIDALTRRLRRQLSELDVESVDQIRAGEAPPGTRAIDVMMLGGLLVTHSPEILKMVVGVVQSWTAGHQGCSVELQIAGDTLKVTGASSDEQRELISLFIERHLS